MCPSFSGTNAGKIRKLKPCCLTWSYLSNLVPAAAQVQSNLPGAAYVTSDIQGDGNRK